MKFKVRAQHLVRNLPMITSGALSVFLNDPRQFLLKVIEKGRQSEVLPKKLSSRLSELIVERSKGKTSRAYKLGNYREALTELELSDLGVFKNAAHRRISRRLELLELDVLKSAPIPGDSLKTARPLFLLTNSFPHTKSGYTERSHATLSALRELKVDVLAVTRLGYPALIGEFFYGQEDIVSKIRYKRLLPLLYPLSITKRIELAAHLLAEVAREHNATVIHTTTDYQNALVASRAAAKLGLPWVYEVRGELENTWLSKQDPQDQQNASKSDHYILTSQQEVKAMRAASAVVALSEVSRQRIISRGIDADTVHVIPNAVDDSILAVEIESKSARDKLNLAQCVTVGTVSSLVSYEGLDDLIRAMVFLPQVRCLIVGDGDSRLKLEGLSEELGLSDRVSFVGRQPREGIENWYAAIDIFVLPRRDEIVCRNVTPIKALMAQALGRPVVASQLPALVEVTGGLGFYIEAGDPRALAEQIQHCLAIDELEIKALRDKSKDWVATRTWSNNAAKYLDIYLGTDKRKEK